MPAAGWKPGAMDLTPPTAAGLSIPGWLERRPVTRTGAGTHRMVVCDRFSSSVQRGFSSCLKKTIDAACVAANVECQSTIGTDTAIGRPFVTNVSVLDAEIYAARSCE